MYVDVAATELHLKAGKFVCSMAARGSYAGIVQSSMTAEQLIVRAIG